MSVDREELRRLCDAANPAGKYEDKSEFFVKARIVLPILLDALEASEAEAVRLQRAWDSAFNQAMENGQRAANAEARERRLRELLAIYVHAHKNGNSVPPNIDGDARSALAETAS